METEMQVSGAYASSVCIVYLEILTVNTLTSTFLLELTLSNLFKLQN